MITTDKIKQIATEALVSTDLYVVEITISPAMDIELTLDADSRVGIDQCVALSRTINSTLEEWGEEDFSLLVGSAGIGNPLKVARQYNRCIGCEVEVTLANGKKLAATLDAFQNDAVTITYLDKVAVEGKKRKVTVECQETFPLTEIKSVCEALTIK